MSIRAERVQDDRPEYSSLHVSAVHITAANAYSLALSPFCFLCFSLSRMLHCMLMNHSQVVQRLFASLQAVMMGPLLMAGITNGSRSIQADPSKVAELLTDVSSKGLVSLTIPGDLPLHIRHDGDMLRAKTMNSAAYSLDASFRLLSRDNRSANEALQECVNWSRSMHGLFDEVILLHVRHSGHFSPVVTWKFGDVVILEAADMPGSYLQVDDHQVSQKRNADVAA